MTTQDEWAKSLKASTLSCHPCSESLAGIIESSVRGKVPGVRGIADQTLLFKPVAALVLTTLICLGSSTASAARFVAYYPSAVGLVTSTNSADLSQVKMSLPAAAPENAADIFDDATSNAWQQYCGAWQQFHQHPNDAALRKRLSIATNPFAYAVNPSNSALTSRMPLTGMKRYDTAHFQLYTDVNQERLQQVVIELEQFYAVWTQIFFPLWNQAPGWIENPQAPRLKAVPKHRVVLFADPARYQEALKTEGDVVAISTGFYSDLLRLSFFCDEGDQRNETIYHELTHQLLLEATSATGRFRPGERSGFWLVEGIATYMESLNRRTDFATIGGWESPRLQFARHRVLGSGVQLQLGELQNESRKVVQRRDDLASWYSHIAAYTHAIIDAPDGGLHSVLGAIAALYQIRRGLKPDTPSSLPTVDLTDYLQLDEESFDAIAFTELRSLCLTRTELTAADLERLPAQKSLRWLDAGFLPIDTASLQRLVPNPRFLKQLNLESTLVDDSLGGWLETAREINELDLSNTRVGDQTIAAMKPTTPLETLWLTGSKVTDASVDKIAQIKSLKQVDLQVTGVSPAGVDRLRSQRPDLTINPLQVQTQ